MRRREFIAALGGAVAWPLMARAQQPERMRRIAVLMGTESDREGRARIAALRQGLQELGWIEDRNFRIDVVWGDADADHIETDAIALVRKSPDVIVANGPVYWVGCICSALVAAGRGVALSAMALLEGRSRVGLVQLVAHHFRDVGVAGSNPATPTNT
jgi:ABC-type sugar transport system substrate-binding protein